MRSSPGAAAALIVSGILFIAGCGSNAAPGTGASPGADASAGHAPGSSGPIAPPMIMTITATPPDIPLNHPACTGYADLPLPVAANLSGLVSACTNPPAYAPDVMVISNLSDFVLDIRSASSSQPAFRAYYPASDNLLPSGDEIETYAQDASVRQLAPPAGTILLPVGGHVIATQDEPIQVSVQVDQYASATSYAAQLMSGYVVDNLTEQIPQDSALSYELSIADCVNAAHSLWQGLYQQPSGDAATTLRTALSTIPACQDLQQKVTSDHAEELSVAAAEHRLTAPVLDQDLARVAEVADQVGWESRIDDVAKAAIGIAEDAH